MPVVKIQWFAGRDQAVKAEVAKDIEKVLVRSAGCPPGSTYIIFEDVEPGNWAIHGELKG